MESTEWMFLVAGVFVGALIVAIADGIRMWETHLELKAQEKAILLLSEGLRHAEAQLHPLRWVDSDPQNNMKVKKRIYDRYEDLVEPGTTTLGPFGLEEST